jgi:hypothetical protein
VRQVGVQRAGKAALPERARDHRQLQQHMHRHRREEDPGAVVVRLHEAEVPGVEELDVEDPRGELEQRAAHEQEERQPLDRHRGAS